MAVSESVILSAFGALFPQLPCEAGKWSSVAARTLPCTDLCDAGYVCRAGSRSSGPQVCGGAHVYCPLGSAAPLPVGAGFFSSGGADVRTQTTREECPDPSASGGVATYCDGTGYKQTCPGGTYGNASRLPSSACSGQCFGGYYCPAGSTSPDMNACGGNEWYCPAGAATRTPLPLGYYSLPEDADVAHRIAGVMCAPGQYCIAGWRYNCSGGTIAYDPGRQLPCTEPCPEGYFCANGTGALSRDIMCASPTTHCPLGSVAARLTAPGHFAIPVAGSRIMFGAQAACEVGTFCFEGVRALCPAGRFGNASLMTSSLCSGSCLAGYYCADGSVNATQEWCGAVEVYCPAGTPRRVAVADGHYSVPLSAPPQLRDGEEPCQPGWYCVQGVRRQCPAGRFGSTAKLTDESCSGPCVAGYFCGAGAIVPNETACGSPEVYCPEGSASPQHVPAGEYSVGLSPETGNDTEPCPAGSFCEGGVQQLCRPGTFGCSIRLQRPQCSGNCSAGYYCRVGAVSNVEHACADEHGEHPHEVYCPSGVGEPQAVDVGYYSYGSASPDRMTAQAQCPAGSYCQYGELVRAVRRCGVLRRLASVNLLLVVFSGDACYAHCVLSSAAMTCRR